MKKYKWIAVLVLLAVLAGLVYISVKEESKEPDPPNVDSPSAVEEGEPAVEVGEPAVEKGEPQVEEGSLLTRAELEEMRRQTIKVWTDGGIGFSAAEGILKYQEADLIQFYLLDKEEYEKRVKYILRLTQSPKLIDGLEKNPDLTSLILGILDTSNGVQGAMNVLDTLEDGDPNGTIRNLYMQFADPKDAAGIAELLKNREYRSWIVKLFEQSPVNIDFVQFFEIAESERKTNPEAAQVYKKWVQDLAEETLRREDDDPEFLKSVMYLTFFTDSVLENLRKNEQFRKGFSEYRVCVDEVIRDLKEDLRADETEYSPEEAGLEAMAFVSNADIWTFVSLFPAHKTRELYRKTGVGACPIFMHEEFYLPADDSDRAKARERLLRLCLTDDGEDFLAVLGELDGKLYGDLRRFLNRDELADAVIVQGGYWLYRNPEEAHDTLAYWNTLSKSALLKEEVFNKNGDGAWGFVPGYDVVKLVGKMADGRRVTGGDVFWAAVDGVTTVASLGVGGVMVKGPGAAGKIAARELTKKTAKAVAKHGGELAVSELKKEVNPVRIASEIFWKTKEASRDIFKFDADISALVRSAFKNSKVGGKSFKKWTNLDARIFMRKDRRVVVRMNPKPHWNVAEDALWEGAGTAAMFICAARAYPLPKLETIKKEYMAMNKHLTKEDLWKMQCSSWWTLVQERNLDFSAENQN